MKKLLFLGRSAQAIQHHHQHMVPETIQNLKNDVIQLWRNTVQSVTNVHKDFAERKYYFDAQDPLKPSTAEPSRNQWRPWTDRDVDIIPEGLRRNLMPLPKLSLIIPLFRYVPFQS